MRSSSADVVQLEEADVTETWPSMDFADSDEVFCPLCLKRNGRLENSVVVCDACDYCSLDGDWSRARVSEDGDQSVASTTTSQVVAVRSDQKPLLNPNTEGQSCNAEKLLETLSKCMKCGNNNDDLFDRISNVGCETVVGLLFCQLCSEFTSKWSYKCEGCGNCSPEWFQEDLDEAGSHLLCLICLRVLQPEKKFALQKLLQLIEDVKEAKKTALLTEEPKCVNRRVKDLQQLRCGDHIAWDREYLVWHHAIVTAVNVDAGEITVIHNSGGIKDLPNGRIASVRVENVPVDCDIDFLYMFEYDENQCFSVDEVIERATRRLDDVYNPLRNNCEHFARWCKTGVKYSNQRKNFDDRLKMGASGFAKVIEECLTSAVQGQIGGLAIAETTTFMRGLQLGAILMGVMLAIFAEIVFFCCKLYEARKDAKANYMTPDVFQRSVIQLFCEGLVGLGGGLGIAFAMSLVPYAGPFISPIGYVLGNWFGRLLGALIARLTMRILHRYKVLR